VTLSGYSEGPKVADTVIEAVQNFAFSSEKPCRARRASYAVLGSGGLFVLDAPTRARSTLRRAPLAVQGPLLRHNDSSRARRPHRRPRPFWL